MRGLLARFWLWVFGTIAAAVEMPPLMDVVFALGEEEGKRKYLRLSVERDEKVPAMWVAHVIMAMYMIKMVLAGFVV